MIRNEFLSLMFLKRQGFFGAFRHGRRAFRSKSSLRSGLSPAIPNAAGGQPPAVTGWPVGAGERSQPVTNPLPPSHPIKVILSAIPHAPLGLFGMAARTPVESGSMCLKAYST